MDVLAQSWAGREGDYQTLVLWAKGDGTAPNLQMYADTQREGRLRTSRRSTPWPRCGGIAGSPRAARANWPRTWCDTSGVRPKGLAAARLCR